MSNNHNLYITDYQYRFGVANFILVDNGLFSEDEKQRLKSDGEYDRQKLILILKNGDWIDSSFRSCLHGFFKKLLSHALPTMENFLICMNEYNQKQYDEWFLHQQTKSKDDILNDIMMNSEKFTPICNAKQVMMEYFSHLSRLGIEPFFLDKSNEELLHPFGKLLNLHKEEYKDTSLSTKYKKLFDTIYHSPDMRNKRIDQAKEIIAILNDKEIFSASRIKKLTSLFPIDIAISPFTLTLEIMDKKSLSKKEGKPEFRKDLDVKKLFVLVDERLHNDIIKSFASKGKLDL